MIKREMSSEKQAELFVEAVNRFVLIGRHGYRKTKKGNFLLTPKQLFVLAKTLIQTSYFFKLPKEELAEIKKYQLDK